MKKIILLSLLSLPLFFLAQTNKQHTPQQLKQKQLDIKQKQNAVDADKKAALEKNKVKPTIVAGSMAYTTLKKQGKLYEYDVQSPNSQTVLIPHNNALAAKTASLTYCDEIPFVGTPSFTTEVDDSPLATVALQFNFCFYGVNYTSLKISANGNVQFSTNSTAFSATGFPSTAVNMIAPFWADGETMVNFGGLTYGKIKVVSNATNMIISWDSLGYFNNNLDKLNSFQLILTDGTDPILPPGKNVGFKYRKMEWTTGDASGGTNGFPTTQPGTPATVGINAGNGTDYFLIGRFGVPGNFYDGPLGASDGVSWLDGRSFYFDACPALGANVAPISLYEIQECDTINVCGNDTLIRFNTFIAPEVGQTVNIVVSAPTLGAALTSFITTNANSAIANIAVDGGLATAGYHIVSMTATDNGSPILSSTQSFVIYVNQGALNNLNGSIAITPTLGACPGGVVSASVTVSGGVPDNYLWNNGNTTSMTTYTTVVPADSLIFITLTSGQCQKTITGNIKINPTPIASISGILEYCNGNASSTVLTATNTLNPASQGPHTYNWSGTGNLSATNTETPSVDAGVYTVTVTNQFGCISIATTTIVMNETPSYTLTSANAISGGSVYCVNQDTARIAINFGPSSGPACGLGTGLCTSPNIISIGTGSTFNTNTGTPCVYGNFYKNERHQMLYTAAELLAAGAVPGKLSSISFQVNSIMPLNTTGTSSSSTYVGTLPNYSIKMKCTSNTVLSSTFDGTGLTQVFFGDVTPVVGVNTHTFSQPYIWDGTSNIIVDVCYTRTVSLASTYYTSNPVMPYTNVGSIKCVYFNSDGTLACGNTTGTTTNNRPDIKFGNCLAQQSGSQFNIVVTPTTGVVIPAAHDSIRIDLPSTPGITCYTVSIINPIGNCSKDTVICVEAIQGVTQGTLAADNYSVCPNQPVTLTAQGTLATYTIQYTDDLGSQTSTVSPVTFNAPATIGAYTYTLLATGPCGGTLTAFTTTVNVNQGTTVGNLTFSQDSVCPGTPVTITANGPILPTYTITYGPAVSDTVIGHSVTITPTLTTYGFQTYTLTAEGACGGPVTNFIDSVKVYLGVTQATITASADTLCPGSPITLNYIGTLASYTMTYTDASGVNTSTTVPVTFTPMAITNPTFGYVTYSLTGVGPCSGPLTSFVDSVFIKQGVTQGTLAVSNGTPCPGDNVTLSALGTLASYTIAYVDANGNLQTSANSSVTFIASNIATPAFGIHTYSLIAEGPCSGPITVFTNTVDVKQGITSATLVPTQSVVCIGSPVTLNATGTAMSTYTIQYNNGAGVISSNNASATFNTAVGGVNTYTLLAQGFCSAPINTYTANVLVNNLLNLSITPMANVTKCLNSSVTLTANVASSAAEPYTYNWSPAVGTNTNSTYSTSTPVTTTFVVTVNGTCANTATASVVVSNFATDINVSIIDSASVCANTELMLHTLTTGGNGPYTYGWTILPDVNSVSSAANLSTSAPATQGTYTVMVVSTDNCGFMDFDTQLITVLPPCTIEVGNIITPNGDGANDYFKVKNIEYHPNTVLTIFDRWGRKVYENQNYANEWKADGSSDGTYFYILDVPQDKAYNGFVQVLR